MPVAAKVEKPAMVNGNKNANNEGNNGKSDNNNSSNMLQELPKIVNTMVDKKVRNLEKRKTRLLELKGLETKGQKLEADQLVAVKKLDGVVEMVDILKDLSSTATDSLIEFAKQLKKQQKKENFEKQQQDALLRTKNAIFLFNCQIISKLLSNEKVKGDLLQGKIGEVDIEEKQGEALGKLNEFIEPKSFDLVESSAEKINNLLDGNKREFIPGVSYSDLKELLSKLIESKYFENISLDEPDSTLVENAKSPKEESNVLSKEVEVAKSEEQAVDKEAVQNVQHVNSQLCFMRDPIVENELQHKDPAVIAVASHGFPYPPQNVQALSTSSGTSIPSNTTYPQQMFTPSIPTQTFTNPSYAMHGNFMIAPNHYQHQQVPISEQQIPVSSHSIVIEPSVAAAGGRGLLGDKGGELTNGDQIGHFSTENNHKETSQGEGKSIPNGSFQKNQRGGGSRGRGQYFNRPRGGRGQNKSFFGYYAGNNNGAGNPPNPNFNPNNRPLNNGGPHRSYRPQQDRTVRNPNQFSEQPNATAN